mgnify:CR=1 FL=1
MNTTVKVISDGGFTPAEIQFGMRTARESGLKIGLGCYQWNDLRRFGSLPTAGKVHSTHCGYCRNMIAAMRRQRSVSQEETKVLARERGWWQRLLSFFGYSK